MKVIQWILLISLEKQKCRTPSLRSELIEIWFNSTACFVVADIIMKYRSRLYANTGSKLVWLAFSLGLVFENSCKIVYLTKIPSRIYLRARGHFQMHNLEESKCWITLIFISLNLILWVQLPISQHWFKWYAINWAHHYTDVIIGTIASQTSSLTIVYSTIYSDADQRKHQSFALLAFVWEIHRRPVNSPHKWPVTRKMFPFDDVIMMKTYSTDAHTLATMLWCVCMILDDVSMGGMLLYTSITCLCVCIICFATCMISGPDG